MLNLIVDSTALFHYVNVPVANMRKNPNFNAEIVSQAYYSEQVNVIQSSSPWVKIETLADRYPGWVLAEQLYTSEGCFPSGSSTVRIHRCMAHLYHLPDTIYGPVLTLPFDSVLELEKNQENDSARWVKIKAIDGVNLFVQKGDLAFSKNILSIDQLPSFSKQFLGLPYTWGGRSSFGYDCSGFVQMLYRQIGIYLPRDSKDQAKSDLMKNISFDKLQAGDLIFFGLDESKIKHVGMSLGSDRFIHSTVAEDAPYIHVSNLSDPEWCGSGKFPYRTVRTLTQRLPAD